MKMVGYIASILFCLIGLTRIALAETDEHGPVKIGDTVYVWNDISQEHRKAYSWELKELEEKGFLPKQIEPLKPEPLKPEPFTIDKNIHPFVGSIASLLHSFNELTQKVKVQFSPVITELKPILQNPIVPLIGMVAFAGIVSRYIMQQQMKALKQTSFHLASEKDMITFKDYIGEIPIAALDLVDQLKNSKKYADMRVRITKGILLYGSPGGGKTYLARAIAGEVGCPFISLNATDFAQSFAGQAKFAVQELFKMAVNAAWWSKTKTAIIFIDEIDAIGKRSGSQAQPFATEIINTLLSEMDGFGQRKDVNIVVIAATNIVDALDPALKRAGRFDYKIEVPLFDFDGREKLISHYSKEFPVDQTVEIPWLATVTEGFSAAEIKFMFELAGRIALRSNETMRNKQSFELAMEEIKKERTASESKDEFRVDAFKPLQKEDLLTFSDYIGNIPLAALDLINQLKYPEKYKAMNIPITKGILLYGPPGSGKTYLARAMAGELGCPFIPINGTGFSETFIGQSKMSVKTLFTTAERAAQASKNKTAIIFIDEIDAIGSRQGITSVVSTEIINTLLSEMDGFSQRKDVNIVVMGATNLIESVDPALRRSGRFDYKIEVPYLDINGREQLIQYFFAKFLTDESMSAHRLAAQTEDFSSADIKFMFELAGRIAIRQDKNIRDALCFEEAIAEIKRDKFMNKEYVNIPLKKLKSQVTY